MSGLTEAEQEALICDCEDSGLGLPEECPAHGGGDHLWMDLPASEVVRRTERIVAAREEAAHAAGVAEGRAEGGNGSGWFWTRAEWAEWSNDLAELIPEDDASRYSNPEGAQEAIIEDCLRAYVAERAALAGTSPQGEGER